MYDPTTRRAAVAAGALFLFASATFLTGDVLIRGYFSAPGEGTGRLTAGVAIQVLAALAGAGIGVALFGVIRRFSRPAAAGYLALRSAEGVMMVAVGIYMLDTKTFVETYELMIYAFTGVAGLMFTNVLRTSGLVAPWLSRLGIVGYVAILLAIPSDLLDVANLRSAIGALFYVPGAIFELVLPILLIAKGFRRTELGSATSVPVESRSARAA